MQEAPFLFLNTKIFHNDTYLYTSYLFRRDVLERPNLAINTIKIDGLNHEVVFSIYSFTGPCLLSNLTNDKIDVSRSANGFYKLEIIIKRELARFKTIKH